VLDIPGGIVYGLLAIPLSIPVIRLYEKKVLTESTL
jgi:hypothetical protein